MFHQKGFLRPEQESRPAYAAERLPFCLLPGDVSGNNSISIVAQFPTLLVPRIIATHWLRPEMAEGAI